MSNLQNDTMLFAQFHVPKGVDLQLNLLSSKLRSVEIENELVKIKLFSERMEATRAWHEPLMVVDVKKDAFLMDRKNAAMFGAIVDAAILISRFMFEHSRWN